MEIVANVQAIVFALGVKTTNVVKQLTEGDAVAVYEGERDHENDAQVMERYEKAVEACRVWLRAVVGTQVIANQSDDICVEAELLMPDRLVEVAVYSAEYPFGGGYNADVVEKLNTPIGKFNYQTYRAILDTPINPVKELYKFFQDLIHQIHNIVVMPLHCDGMDDLLNKYIVEDEGIVDVLGVSRYDALWNNVMDFMEYDYSEPVPDFNFIENELNNLSPEIEKTVFAMHVKPFEFVFNNNVAKIFQLYVNQFPKVQFCLYGHEHKFAVDDLFNDGVLYFQCPCIDKRIYLLFTIKEDGTYDYETVEF